MNKTHKDLAKNKQAFFRYEILETFEAGIALKGTEVKSLKAGGGSLQEAYVKVENKELWLIGANIAPYAQGNVFNHDPKRPRKLLMHKREIVKLQNASREKGLTLVPLALYLKKNHIKIKIAIAQGKKNIDKRASIKEREEKRRMDRFLKG